MISSRHSPRLQKPISHCHSAASPSASRTTSMCSANLAPAAQNSSRKITSHPTTPPSFANSALPARFLSADSTWTNSPWARRRKIPRCKRPATRTTHRAFQADPPADRPLPWQTAPPSPRSAPTPAARFANRLRTAALSDSSHPTGEFHATVLWRLPRHLIRSDHSRNRSRTRQ